MIAVNQDLFRIILRDPRGSTLIGLKAGYVLTCEVLFSLEMIFCLTLVSQLQIMKTVITRVWHGTTPVSKAEAYLKFLLEKGVNDYKNTPGNLSVQVWRRAEPEKVHFYTVTTWDSIESIKKFAGDEVRRARYYPEDKDYLVEYEPDVMHCETFIP